MKSFLRPFASAFRFFLFAARKNRRSRTFFFVSLLPALAAAVIAVGRLVLPDARIDGRSEEIENRTLTYLTTRPVSKPALLLGKFAAVVLLQAVFLVVGLAAAFLLLYAGGLGEGAAWVRFARSAGILVLGLVCYSAFFTLAGTFLKRPILFGLFFAFGWETVVQYFPGATQRLTLMHYLKSLLPIGTTGGGKFDFLIYRLEPSPAAAAVFARREYLFED
jgi:ABC-2 type transport system permease protein